MLNIVRLRARLGRGALLTAAAAAFAAAPLAIPAASPAEAAAKGSSVSRAVNDFYRARGGRLIWLAPNARGAGYQLLQLLSTAQADNLNPRRYPVRQIGRALQAAQRGNPAAMQRADIMLSEAFVAYARDMRHDPGVGIIYVDAALKPQPPSVHTLLSEAATSPRLGDYVQQLGWMNPVYGKLRQALASRLYRSEHERQLLALKLERARALPAGGQRYVVINNAAARLYMYENGQMVDSMRVVTGKPTPAAQTPMMNAFIRFAVLNPYWNSPTDITAERLAPNVLKQGTSYLKAKGYEVMSDWSENARVVSPASVDWKAVVAGREQIRLRQKPGPANSMGRMKFMFPNTQGIWHHDTPLKEKNEEAARLASNGCVRLEDAPRFARWLFGKPLKPQGARPEQRVALPTPVPLYITYLTAVPSGSSIVYFDDFYGWDRAGLRRQS
jgi:murein L,D-transpeptidase YcbB/YkuD